MVRQGDVIAILEGVLPKKEPGEGVHRAGFNMAPNQRGGWGAEKMGKDPTAWVGSRIEGRIQGQGHGDQSGSWIAYVWARLSRGILAGQR